MAIQKFLTLVNGIFRLKSANDSSAGSGDAGKIIALNADGLLDPSIRRLKNTTVTNSDLSLLASHEMVAFQTGSSERICTPSSPTGLGGQRWLIGKTSGTGAVRIIGGDGGADFVFAGNEWYWLICDGSGYFVK